SRAERMALRAGGTSGTLEVLGDGLRDADLVVTVTGATGLVIGIDTVRDAVTARDDRPLFFLDLAVPRDVDPGVRDLAGVGLADIDDLRAVVNGADGDEVDRVRAIVEEEAKRFADWRRAERVVPLIQDLYGRAESIRRSELRRIDARLARMSGEERAAV